MCVCLCVCACSSVCISVRVDVCCLALVLKLHYKVASSQLPAPQIAPRTKVALQSRQFSASSSADTPRTKVALQSRQFSASSSTDAVPATKSAHGGLQSAVPGTKSAHGGSQSAVPATKSAHEGSQSAAPATKSAHQAPVPSRRQGVHPTPWQPASAAHSTQMLPAERRCPADARAYIRPLGKQQAPHTVHMEVHKVLCLPRDLRMKVHKVLRLPRNLHIKRRCPADARAYIRPLGKQQSAAPATRSAHGGSQSTAPATKSAHQAPVPSRRQGVHPTPRQAASAAHSAHGGSQSAVPATRSAHGGLQSTAPATKSAHEGSQSAAPATKSAHQAPVPSRRQGVHPTPWQAAKRCACHEICARKFTKYCACYENLHIKGHKALRLPRNLHIKRRCPADARAYIRPLGRQQSAVPATKSAYEGSQSAAPATKSAHQAPVPSRRQGVHSTPWQAASAVHSTQMLPAERRCPADARAYIRPLGKQQAPHTVHTQVHKVLCLPRDLRMKVHKVLRLPRNLHIKRRCPADARAYIRPLGKQQSAVPATRSAHGGSQSTAPATKSAHEGSQSAARATKSAHQAPVPADARAYMRPLGRQQSAVPATRSAHGGSQSTAPATKSAHEGSQSAAPATRSAHQAPVPSRRQGVHPTPRPAAKCCACKCCACHEICTSSAGAQPTPGRTSDPLASSKRHTQCTWFTKCCACHEICA